MELSLHSCPLPFKAFFVPAAFVACPRADERGLCEGAAAVAAHHGAAAERRGAAVRPPRGLWLGPRTASGQPLRRCALLKGRAHMREIRNARFLHEASELWTKTCQRKQLEMA